jgi:antimicrobial peptide system SdpB family protein
VGAARSALALATLLTLVATDLDLLFRPTGEMESGAMMGLPTEINVFLVADGAHLALARGVALVVLAVVASGWRPRWTALPHWWVTWSFTTATAVPEGGDHLATGLTLLLLPVALTDPRRWHWADPRRWHWADPHPRRWADPPGGRRTDDIKPPGPIRLELARSALWVVRLQVAVVYLHAAVAKLGSTDWVTGSALFYWMRHPVYGAPTWLVDPLSATLSYGPVVAALTWGVIVLELLLAAGLVIHRDRRGPLLVAGLAFHAGIALLQGLVSFGLVMAGALILYLRPVDAPLAWPRWLPRSGFPRSWLPRSWLPPSRIRSEAPDPFRPGGSM